MVHLGTNDIDTEDPETVAVNILELASHLRVRYNCRVFVSPLPPRGDDMNPKAIATNIALRNSFNQYDVTLLSQPNLSIEHMHDAKHLATKRSPGQLSGVQHLAASIYRGVTGVAASQNQLFRMQTWVTPLHQEAHN